VDEAIDLTQGEGAAEEEDAVGQQDVGSFPGPPSQHGAISSALGTMAADGTRGCGSAVRSGPPCRQVHATVGGSPSAEAVAHAGGAGSVPRASLGVSLRPNETDDVPSAPPRR
jgi:hypothetical protein